MRMKKRGPAMPGGQGASLMALMTLFLVGAVVGSFFAANISGAGQRYVERFLTDSALAGPTGVLRVAGVEMLFMLAVFASAFFPLGLALAPLALGAKGFMLSLLVSAFVKTFGPLGYAVSLALAVLLGFVSVTCLMLVALQAMGLARQRAARMGGRIYMDRAYFLSAGICTALTLLASVLYCYMTPVVGRVVVGMG